ARLNRGNDGGLNVAGTVRRLLRVVQQDAVNGNLVPGLPRLLGLLRGLTLDQPHLSALSLERLVNLVARDIDLAGRVVVVTEHREVALVVRRTVNGGVHIDAQLGVVDRLRGGRAEGVPGLSDTARRINTGIQLGNGRRVRISGGSGQDSELRAPISQGLNCHGQFSSFLNGAGAGRALDLGVSDRCGNRRSHTAGTRCGSFSLVRVSEK